LAWLAGLAPCVLSAQVVFRQALPLFGLVGWFSSVCFVRPCGFRQALPLFGLVGWFGSACFVRVGGFSSGFTIIWQG